MSRSIEALAKATEQRHKQAETAVEKALRQARTSHQPVSVASIARAAGVSTDFIYRHPTLRPQVEALRRARRSTTSTTAAPGPSPKLRPAPWSAGSPSNSPQSVANTASSLSSCRTPSLQRTANSYPFAAGWECTELVDSQLRNTGRYHPHASLPRTLRRHPNGQARQN